MKKILFFIVAVISLTTFSSSQASAEMLTLTSTNGGSFTFDATSGGDNLVTTNGDDGLNDIAFFLGYQTGGGATAPETDFVALNSGSGSVSGDTGTFTFDTVTFDNGVSVDAVANFRLVDATGSGLGHQVVYDLSLQTNGVSNATEGSLQSFVGFDFNGNGADIAQDNQEISSFGTSDVAIGSASGDRSLLGDFTFPIAQDLSLIHI